MKIQAVPFEPRRTRPAPGIFASHLPHPTRAALQAENPGLARGLGLAHAGTEVLEGRVPQALAGGAYVLLAAGALTWGVSKLAKGETNLDRLEGVGHLALAGESALTAAATWHEAAGYARLARPLGLTYAVSEVVVGGGDLLRASREKSALRGAVGLCQVGSGAALLAAQAWPGAAPLCLAGALGSQLLRQALLGL